MADGGDEKALSLNPFHFTVIPHVGMAWVCGRGKTGLEQNRTEHEEAKDKASV